MIQVNTEMWEVLRRANNALATALKEKIEKCKELQNTNNSLLRECSKFESENDEYKAIIADQNKELVKLKSDLHDMEYISYATQ